MVLRFFCACRLTWSRARLMASCMESSDSWMLLTSCSLPTMRISQMLRYFSTWTTTRMSMTASKSRSTILFSFFSTKARMSGVTSKLRQMSPVARETLLEHLLAVGRRRDVQLVAVLGHGTARDVNPFVVQNLHDFGV